MRSVQVGMLAALLCLSMAGSASACSGDDVQILICGVQDAVFGPSGVVPYATNEAAEIGAFVFDLLPTIVLPWGGLL